MRVAGSTSGHDDETEMITSSSCTSAYEVLDAVGALGALGDAGGALGGAGGALGDAGGALGDAGDALGTTSWGTVNDAIARRKEEEHGSWRVAGKEGKRRLQFVTREGECLSDRGILKQVQSRAMLQPVPSRISLPLASIDMLQHVSRLNLLAYLASSSFVPWRISLPVYRQL